MKSNTTYLRGQIIACTQTGKKIKFFFIRAMKIEGKKKERKWPIMAYNEGIDKHYEKVKQ